MTKNEKSKRSHCCDWSCLGPLTFDQQVVGDLVLLSPGGRRAQRTGTTFNNGLVFSSRPVEVQERLRLRVEGHRPRWSGALRVGFTTVPPRTRTLPLPSLLFPQLSDTPGHWAAPVPEVFCPIGSEVEFWVSQGGNLYIRSCDGWKHKLLRGVDLSRPLWAMVELYGQTSAVLLMGSNKACWFGRRQSCLSPDADDHYDLDHVPDASSSLEPLSDDNSNRISHPDMERPPDSEKSCVVCMDQEAEVMLRCGHRCLCPRCSVRVIQELGTCPLCRVEL
ncbi:E3 ubiquitin-protein ligase NEURL3 [Diretmus argenteus]